MNPNTGHGHVFERPDGVRMRCGGPALCADCARDQVRKDQSLKSTTHPDQFLTAGEVSRRDNKRLIEAIEAVYFAAHWSPDRECDATKLWTELRDAAGITPGQTANLLGPSRL
jgi:hypothetical protein